MEDRVKKQRERVKNICDGIDTNQEYKVLYNGRGVVVIYLGSDKDILKLERLEEINDQELKQYLIDEAFITTLYSKRQAFKVVQKYLKDNYIEEEDQTIHLPDDSLSEILRNLTGKLFIDSINDINDTYYYNYRVKVGYYEKQLDSTIYFYEIKSYSKDDIRSRVCHDIDACHDYYNSIEDIVNLLMKIQNKYYEVSGKINF